MGYGNGTEEEIALRSAAQLQVHATSPTSYPPYFLTSPSPLCCCVHIGGALLGILRLQMVSGAAFIAH